jgi:hypothetical protein
MMAKKMKAAVPLPKLIKKTQTIVNAYVRKRDEGKPCISCGQPGNQAGHYFSAGQYSALRFDPDNIHLQCTRCNLFLSGNLIEYGMGLIKRYGELFHISLLQKSRERVKKWQRDELNEIIEKYK